MTENEAIKELKDENEQCYEQCEGHCSDVINNVCTCRDATILSALEQYRAIGTVEECRMAMDSRNPVAPETSSQFYICPRCKARKNIMMKSKFCSECGQAFE